MEDKENLSFLDQPLHFLSTLLTLSTLNQPTSTHPHLPCQHLMVKLDRKLVL